jgi:hypothetical protein
MVVPPLDNGATPVESHLGPSPNNLERCIYHTTIQEGRS